MKSGRAGGGSGFGEEKSGRVASVMKEKRRRRLSSVRLGLCGLSSSIDPRGGEGPPVEP